MVSYDNEGKKRKQKKIHKLLKEQMMTSVRKTLKMQVWSVQNRLISSEICHENNHKIGHFLPIAF